GLLGQHGIPTLSVPAGFTTHVFHRVRDATARSGRRLVGPFTAKLPVGIMFFGWPFSEPTVFRIASAYEAATKHRIPPPDFGPVAEEERPADVAHVGEIMEQQDKTELRLTEEQADEVRRRQAERDPETVTL